MNDSQILSTFQESPALARARPRVLVFDACHVGVVLRAVLFVEVVMAVGAMFGAVDVSDWLLRLALISAAVRSHLQAIGTDAVDGARELVERYVERATLTRKQLLTR